MNMYPLREQILQLHSVMGWLAVVELCSLGLNVPMTSAWSSGGDAVTVYLKAPQWHDALSASC